MNIEQETKRTLNGNGMGMNGLLNRPFVGIFFTHIVCRSCFVSMYVHTYLLFHIISPATMAIINRHFPELRSSINFESIFPFLVQSDLMDSEEREMVMLPTITTIRKVDQVLLKLHTRGPDSLPKFISALRKSSAGTDHNRIADVLETDWKEACQSRRVLKFDFGKGMPDMLIDRLCNSVCNDCKVVVSIDVKRNMSLVACE